MVESVGQNVTEFKAGDEVYGTCDGSFATYARARAGKLVPAVDRTYPLSQTPAAISYFLQGRARGKAVITI